MTDGIARVETLRGSLRALTSGQAAIFCAACAERLLPNYFCFAVESGAGNPASLRAALDLCWDIVRGKQVGQSQSKLAEALQICEKLTPDTEDFADASASAALDAANAVYYALHCLQTGDSRNALYASQCGIDTVDLHLRAQTLPAGLVGKSEETFIYSHELMLEEIRNQEHILREIMRDEIVSDDQIATLRDYCWNGGKSNIGAIWA